MNLSVLRALMAGNILECYDFLLYSFFISILSPLFFPSSDPLTALMVGFGVFAVGLAARPFGALAFGHWGDKYGRKKALLGTLILMAVATLGIGLLPTYKEIGLLAPFLLITYRFLQGFSMGGETSGAAIFCLEQAPPAKHGFLGGLMRSSTSIGSLLATLMGILFTNDFMPEWAWRIPFCIGGLIAIVGLHLRRTLTETVKEHSRKTPFFNVIQHFPLSFLKAIGIGGVLHIPFYTIATYMNPTLHTKGLITNFELMTMNMFATLVYALSFPLLGYFSDKIGKHSFMKAGMIGQIILVLPLFMIYAQENSVGFLLLMQVCFLIVTGAFMAPSSAYLNTLFPPDCRFSGVAFGTCLGTAIFGGTAPLICSQLTAFMGPLGPSLYLMGTALMGLIAIRQKEPFLALAH